MKAIVLAGGTGSRLFPTTRGVSKQLLPVYDKPMIYYPLSVVMQANIREVLIITTPEDQSAFQRLLQGGEQWGMQIHYATQKSPKGIAEALWIGADFVGEEDVMLILGDNIFYGVGLKTQLEQAQQDLTQNQASIFAYYVDHPQRYGVVHFDEQGSALSIEEKPANPKSNYAVTGMYFYPNNAVQIARGLRPSPRGEFEITDLNQAFLSQNRLQVRTLPEGFAWLDTGTHESLIEAGQLVYTLEKRQGLKVGCVEEIALQNGWISQAQLTDWAATFAQSSYGAYLIAKYR